MAANWRLASVQSTRNLPTWVPFSTTARPLDTKSPRERVPARWRGGGYLTTRRTTSVKARGVFVKRSTWTLWKLTFFSKALIGRAASLTMSAFPNSRKWPWLLVICRPLTRASPARELQTTSNSQISFPAKASATQARDRESQTARRSPRASREARFSAVPAVATMRLRPRSRQRSSSAVPRAPAAEWTRAVFPRRSTFFRTTSKAHRAVTYAVKFPTAAASEAALSSSIFPACVESTTHTVAKGVVRVIPTTRSPMAKSASGPAKTTTPPTSTPR
mmetsp:Transcript_11799/g.38828  ORF Transcript_11799/g.38828 Transcript_11799/m.38828 type:complete len:276 (+) Transcript_11799:1387-2214(+)